MKPQKTLLSIILLIFGLIAIQLFFSHKADAQITLTNSSLSGFLNGEFTISSSVSTDGENILPLIDQKGADQVWDFTTLTFDESFSADGIIETFTDISGSPGAGEPHFDQATHVSRAGFSFDGIIEGEEIQFDFLSYNYIIFNEDSLTDLGSIQVDGDTDEIETTIFNRPGVVNFKFPVNFEDTWEYEYESEISGPFGSTTEFSVIAEVDGWGQIITPEGSFNVLRITKSETSLILGFLEVKTLTISFVNETGIEIATITTEEDPESPGEFDPEITDASLLNSVSSGMTTSNEELISEVPDQIRLNQNYPNPFNPSTQITYELANPANVSLDVYSITGEKIITLVNNRFQQAGPHTVSFEASNLASGIYIYQLKTENQVFTRKMTLIK